jgi:hypothetical protein
LSNIGACDAIFHGTTRTQMPTAGAWRRVNMSIAPFDDGSRFFTVLFVRCCRVFPFSVPWIQGQ